MINGFAVVFWLIAIASITCVLANVMADWYCKPLRDEAERIRAETKEWLDFCASPEPDRFKAEYIASDPWAANTLKSMQAIYEGKEWN